VACAENESKKKMLIDDLLDQQGLHRNCEMMAVLQ